jgi:HK97 family phage portal protein
VPIVQSFGALQALGDPAAGPTWVSGGSLALAGRLQSYATIYRTQPNVRTVIDFLSRNIAQLGLHVFRRISDTDRERLADHPLARTIGHPNPATTRYRLFESTLQDLGIYFNCIWLKLRAPGRLGIVRLPPEQIEIEGGIFPTTYTWRPPNGKTRTFAPADVVHFSGYDPLNPLMGVSPLETLRRVLAEEAAAGDYRESFWANAARMEGIIERPATAPEWEDWQRKEFRKQWQEAHAGGENSGKTAILEDGMTWKATGFSMKASEYLGARKLTREECAAAYHIPLPMVGILEHATFSNIKEQHKHLYQDCLGPWLVMIEEEIERQLLADEFFGGDQEGIYTEFNIAEKLKGSFEEQATSIFQLVGGPVMTRNEGRARLNLPRLDDAGADRLVTPLNVRDTPSAMPDAPPAAAAPTAEQWAAPVRACWQRQAARLQKEPVAERANRFDQRRWTRELAADLQRLFVAAGCADADADRRAVEMASVINQETWERLAGGRDPFPADRPVTVPRLAREEYSEA